MQPSIVITIYAVLVVLSSLLGGFLPALIRLNHTRLRLLLSGIGGLMLGIGLFHLLPHSLNAEVSIDRAVWWLMLGLLTTFLLIRVFSSHDHGHSHDAHAEAGGHGCSHEDPHRLSGSKYRWVGIALGLSLHTLLDGVALSAAVLSDSQHMSGAIFLGFAVFLGVLLHKPLDSLSITTLMAGSGWSMRSQTVVNCGYAMMCPLGALAFYLGVRLCGRNFHLYFVGGFAARVAIPYPRSVQTHGDVALRCGTCARTTLSGTCTFARFQFPPS